MPTAQLPATTPSLSSLLHRWAGEHPGRQALADVAGTLAETAARLAAVVAITPLKLALTSSSNPLDGYAEKQFISALAAHPVAAVHVRGHDEPVPLTAGGSLVVALSPVAGSANLEINAPAGTIFSVLPSRAGGRSRGPASALLQPGRRQLAAGIVVYGPSTTLILTLGDGTDVYVLDPRSQDFRLIRQRVQVPPESCEYAVNAAKARHWGPGIRQYVDDLVSGADGPRERDFTMHWLASLAAEVYRILTRGGIFLCPADDRPGHRQGRAALVHEANPVALLCEQAGGAAIDGTAAILDLKPARLDQRVPLVCGSRSKVERVGRYLTHPQPGHERSPLFRDRGLFHR